MHAAAGPSWALLVRNRQTQASFLSTTGGLGGDEPRHPPRALLPALSHPSWQEYLGGPVGLMPSPSFPAGLLGAEENSCAPPQCPHVPGGNAFLPVAGVAPALTLSWHLPSHPTPTMPHAASGQSGQVQPGQHRDGTGGAGTHSGNARLLVVAHTPIHCSDDEDVFSLGLTVKQSRGGDFTCRRQGCVGEGMGGPGRDQGRSKERGKEEERVRARRSDTGKIK